MEVQTVNNHLNNSLISPPALSQSQQAQLNNSITTLSRSNSPASSNSEIEKELQDLDLNSSLNSGSVSLGADLNCKSNGSLSGASTTSSTTGLTTSVTTAAAAAGIRTTSSTEALINGNGADATNTTINTFAVSQVKKRISSSRTPTRKARRIKFYRNGDRFYPGITIPVSNERYRQVKLAFSNLFKYFYTIDKTLQIIREPF